MSYKWAPVIGSLREAENSLVFQGGTSPGPDGRAILNVGNFICDQYFGGGQIEGQVTFESTTVNSACEFILYYQPSTRNFVTAGIGANSFCSIRSWIGTQWIIHAAAGDRGELRANVAYDLKVRVIGSRVIVSINGVNIITTTLPGPLPTGQAGLWCIGPANISIKSFKVTQEKGKVFSVMQFSNQFNELYSEVIKPVCSDFGLVAIRADEVVGPGIILADIIREIVDAKIIIADITPSNPNVYYEVGYAHALNKPTILIAEKPTQLPFDVSPFRVLFYENTIGGKARVMQGLRKHIEAIQSQWTTT